MSSVTIESQPVRVTSVRLWADATAGGIVAGVGMGLIMHFVMGAMPLIGALYGQPTVVAGWIAHLVHSVLFALVFAFVVTRPTFGEYGLLAVTGLGAAYGIILELVAAGLVLPVWANAVGMGPLPVPFLLPIGFLTHVVYGVLLGAVFGFLWHRGTGVASMPAELEQPAG